MYYYWPLVILFDITHLFEKKKKFQVLLCITNNSIKYQSLHTVKASNNSILFVGTHFKYPIDRTLSSGPGNDDNEWVLHISQISKTGASPSDGFVSYTGHSFGDGLTPLLRCSWYILLPKLAGNASHQIKVITMNIFNCICAVKVHVMMQGIQTYILYI